MKRKLPLTTARCETVVGFAGVAKGRTQKESVMKLHIKLTIAALVIAGSATYLAAQDSNAPRQRPQAGIDRPQRPPVPPLMALLDANRDGVIDASEIDNAPAALRKLDTDNNGQLTIEELRLRRGEGPGFRGQGGPGGFERGPRRGQGRPPFAGGPGHHHPGGRPDGAPPVDAPEQD
jgi:hypothetical protein